MQKFCDYRIEKYIPEYARFPSTVWADLNEELCVETTNACESFHAHFKQEFYHAHPPIYTFLNALINFQIGTYVTMRSCNQSEQKSKKTKEKYGAMVNSYKTDKNVNSLR